MGRHDLTINGTHYSVDVLEIAGGRASVDVDGVIYRVDLRGAAAPKPAEVSATRPEPPAPRSVTAPSPTSGEIVASPMPGHILSVSVKVGDRVEAGETVVVMEAMKMENEIKAHLTGRVVAVPVGKGEDVGVNQALVVIET